jgi:hypothetical protein
MPRIISSAINVKAAAQASGSVRGTKAVALAVAKAPPDLCQKRARSYFYLRKSAKGANLAPQSPIISLWAA